MRSLPAGLLLFVLACGTDQPGGPAGPNIGGKINPAEAPNDDAPAIQSNDVLARETVTQKVSVKHILVGWRELSGAYQGHMDPRANRTRQQADELAVVLLERARKGDDFDALVKQYSEDPGSNKNADPYEVSASAKLVFEFKRLSMRLKLDEVGLVKSDYGWHIIKRVE